jgi:hypothetical protein
MVQLALILRGNILAPLACLFLQPASSFAASLRRPAMFRSLSKRLNLFESSDAQLFVHYTKIERASGLTG